MKMPGIRISPRPNNEHPVEGKAAVMCGITSLIGISKPVATATITLYPPVNLGVIKTQNMS
jgi:hypothetical protein